jgi:hypothetical protein
MGQCAEYAEVGEWWPRERSYYEQDLLDRYTSRKFHDFMDSRMLVSHFKYGDSRDGYPEKLKAVDNIAVRVQKYLDTGNAEWLVDAANFCMLEFMHPSVPNAYFKATDSHESPGNKYSDGSFRVGKHSEQ